MKFIIHGNTPSVKTGYGVQGAMLADQLTLAGHEVAFSSTYGQQFGMGKWTTPHGHDVLLYPNGYVVNSADIMLGHADHFFEGDPKAGWIITILDVWSLMAAAEALSEYQVVSWTPVDHFPVPQEVAAFLAISEAVPLAMSRFGEDLLTQAGLTPAYSPLVVDTAVFKPTFSVDMISEVMSSRDLFDVPDGAFVVGMVSMNKDPQDRKSFNESFRAFSLFWQDHQNAVMLVHTDQFGSAGGLDLAKMASHAGVPQHALIFTDQYAYRIGQAPNVLAALYTAMDVLLAPSKGEGFCVPLIEAQACGTPVIVSDFSAQPELVGAGWKVPGQPFWDSGQSASYVIPFIHKIYDALEVAYRELSADADGIAAAAIEFAAGYDVVKVFEERWVPFLATLEPDVRPPHAAMETVDVIVPLMRPDKLDALVASIDDDRAHVIVVHDDGIDLPLRNNWADHSTRRDHTTYAEKINAGLEKSDAAWVLVVGDDVEFTPGWFDAAAAVSETADVIGTNDSEAGRTRNAEVAAGRHSDHFFIRRAYIDDEGASLDGPGVAMPEAYRHWYVDREVIQLAKARGAYSHAHECRIVHHHPGYDGDEDAREADPVYMMAVDNAEADQRTWLERAPLIEQHRTSR